MKWRQCLGRLALAALLLGVVPAARADEEAAPPLMERLAQGWQTHLRLLTFGTAIAPADSARNPDNRIMALARYNAAIHLRPDLMLERQPLTLSLQPRAELQWDSWREGPRQGEYRWDDELYIHQWLARWACTESFHLSYGRENLQWGPAYLTSPSNPFFTDNGRGNPKTELPAADFARAVWVPHMLWSISLIANTDPGRSQNQDDDFTEAWAAKADYTGASDYGSLILAAGPAQRRQIGGFYGRTLSDALLMYAEGALLANPGGRYPEGADNPLGGAMTPRDDDGADRWKAAALIGGSYTLQSGPTVGVEYLYYGPGYDGEAADSFFDLQERAARAIDPPGGLAPLGYATLSRTADPGLPFLRRNYLMIQGLQSEMAGVIDLTVRWTQNLDDGSGRLTGIGEWSLGDHLQLFAVGSANRGSAHTEFGSIFDYQVMLGMEYIF